MSISRGHDVLYVRFRAPSLDLMRRFLCDFGMTEVPWTPTRLFMRGHDAIPFSHITEQGVPGFAGFAIAVESAAEVRKLAKHDGVTWGPLEAPGGGIVAKLTDPDGFEVEVVAEQTRVETMVLPEALVWNHSGRHPRRRTRRRVREGPSHVRRLGHVVLAVADFRRSEAWYKERFGLLTSDEIQSAPGVAVGAFLRSDRGDQPSDHHTVFLLQHPGPPGFMHAAFEVADLDDLMVGHDHLMRAGYDHLWGIGRHHLGSQIFDYWKDPFGNEIEHWTDGDQLIATDGGGVGSVQELMGVQWGMEMPPLPGSEGMQS
jgi:catechol 2,3-dioxygenase-like lactoylglutathione lyase family enzyme